MNKIRIIVYTPSMNGCTLHRLLIPYKKLAEDERFDVVFFTPTAHTLAEVIEVVEGAQYFVFNRSIDPRLQEALLTIPSIKLVCDEDDWIYIDTMHPLYLQYKMSKASDKFKWCIENSHIITTTTEHLAKQLATINPNVYVLPNALECNESYPATKTASDKIRFGLIGGSSHTKDMELLNGLANQLGKDVCSKIQFVLCGFDKGDITQYHTDGTYTKSPLPWEKNCWVHWEKDLSDNYNNVSDPHKAFLQQYINQDVDYNESYRRIWTKDIFNYAKSYQYFDCLLVPLVDNTFNRNKSPLKLVESMVTNTGVLCSDVEPYSLYLNDKQQVSNVKGTKGWCKAIKKYINDPDKQSYVPNNLPSLEEVNERRKKLYLDDQRSGATECD